MTRAVAALQTATGFLLVIFPPAAAGVMLLLGAVRRRLGPAAVWVLVWGGYLLPLAIVALVTGRDLLMPTLQAVLGLAVGIFAFVDRPRMLTLGIAVALVVSAGAGLVERELSRRLWWDSSTPMGVSHLVSGVSELSGDSSGWSRNGVRLFDKTWTVRGHSTSEVGSQDEDADLTLTFDLRGESQAFGWQWYSNDPGTEQELLSEGGEAFTRISGLVAPVVRRVRTKAPMAGRTVRATVELRSSSPVEVEACPAFALRTFQPPASTCQPLSLAPEWRTFQTSFTFPPDSGQTAFEVVIGPIATAHLDIRKLTVEEAVGGKWLSFDTPEPAGVNVRVPLPGVHVFAQPTLNVRPATDWKNYSLSIPSDQLAAESRITALLQVEAETNIELRNVRLGSRSDDAKETVAEPKSRSNLLFEQANLAGHSYVASGLMAIVLALGFASGRSGRRFTSRPLVVALLVSLAVVAAVATTGSRTAFYGGSVGVVALLLYGYTSRFSHPGRWLVAALGVLVLAALGLVAMDSSGGGLGRLAFWQDDPSSNQVSRSEIWESAMFGIKQSPLSGRGAETFAELWRETHPEDGRAVPRHAHNFWLQATVSYGLPGLFGALWLSGGLVLIAARSKRPEMLIVVLVILAMQALDNTLTHIGVLLPLVFVLNLGTTRSKGTPSSRSYG